MSTEEVGNFNTSLCGGGRAASFSYHDVIIDDAISNATNSYAHTTQSNRFRPFSRKCVLQHARFEYTRNARS